MNESLAIQTCIQRQEEAGAATTGVCSDGGNSRLLVPGSPVAPDMECRNVSFELRNGHGDGHTDVSITPDGQTILTSGSDGECRLWQKEDEFQDCESFPVGTAVYAVAIQVLTGLCRLSFPSPISPSNRETSTTSLLMQTT